MKNKTNAIVRKTIPFGPSEQDLYDYVVEQCNLEGIKFAYFIKRLIRQSKDQPMSVDDKLEKVLDDYFKNKNINIKESEKSLDIVNFNTNDISALLTFMKK
jgi:hypothetical protein